MKRLLSFIAAACMLMCAFSSVAPINAVTHGYLLGDANDDGMVSAKDIIAIRRYLVGLEREKNISLLAADVNKNSDVTMDDVIEIRKYLVGLSPLEENNSDDRYKVDLVTVDNKNISRYTIVIPDKNDECMSYSAGRLKYYIENACGVELNITDDETSVPGYMIKYRYDPDDMYFLGKEGYRIEVGDDGNITFTCGSMRGALYVTFSFLEEFIGWRFLTDKENVLTYLYGSECVDIPAGYEETEIPVFTYRASTQAGSSYYNFPMLKLNAVDGSGSRACAYVQYGWGVGTAGDHAHSYSSQCGVKTDTQPCLTKETTYEQIIDYCRKFIDDRESRGQYIGKQYTQISCSPNDNTDFCSCSECKRVYAEEGSISGTVFRLSNRVAETLGAEYPGIEIFTIAYWDARKPPRMTRPLENVCVCYCIGGCNNHSYDCSRMCTENGGNERLPYVNYEGGNEGGNSNAVEMEYFDRWLELTNNVYIWYYSASFGYYLAPSPNLFNVYNDLKYIAEHGATGVYSEGNDDAIYSFELLRGYIIAKMMWDPFMSEEEYNTLFNEYLMIYYGDGWEHIREYIEISDRAADLNGCWTNNFDRPWNMYNKEYFAENYDLMSELFDKALSKAESEEQKLRITRCRMHCDFLGLSATYESDWLNGSEAEKAVYAERYETFYNTIVETGKADPSFSLFANGGDYKYGCKNFPLSAEDIHDPMSWLLDGFTGYWVWNGDRWV